MNAPTGSLPALTDLYLLRCEVEGKSPRTVRAYRETLTRFQRALVTLEAPMLVTELTSEHIYRYLATFTHLGTETRHRYFREVRCFFNWLVDNGHLETSPFGGMRNAPKQVESFVHEEAKRPNIPTAEHRSVMAEEEQSAIQVAIERRNRDLDPQLVWRGKDEQDQADLVVQAPPLYIQEKVHPKALIDDLRRQSEQASAEREAQTEGFQYDLFSDFNGLPEGAERTEFYQHEGNWSNRMILGDSLQVMASLAEREGLRGKVQCIYIDPPYGINFRSNFQWSTTSREVKDGDSSHLTRDLEQVKAFRDTWRDGIHSYLTYLRDRLFIARDLLTDSGGVFVQIGDENVHHARDLMDEVFGKSNYILARSLSRRRESGKRIVGACQRFHSLLRA